jgi:hypothetical protein
VNPGFQDGRVEIARRIPVQGLAVQKAVDCVVHVGRVPLSRPVSPAL